MSGYRPGQAVRILPTAPGSAGATGGLAVVRRVNRSTVSLVRLCDDAELRVEPEHLVDAEVRLGLEVGTVAGDWLAELGIELEPAEDVLVVVPCGARKLDAPAPAAELYTGPLFRSAWAAAGRLGHRTVILSARHGLVSPDTVLEPYERRLGDPGSVTVEELAVQAAELGRPTRVVVLGGRDYVELARAVWPDAEAPLAGARGIGDMRGRLSGLSSLEEVAS